MTTRRCDAIRPAKAASTIFRIGILGKANVAGAERAAELTDPAPQHCIKTMVPAGWRGGGVRESEPLRVTHAAKQLADARSNPARR